MLGHQIVVLNKFLIVITIILILTIINNNNNNYNILILGKINKGKAR